MVPVALKYMIDIVIPTLLENLDETKDLYIRHGSLVAVGFVVRGLADVGSVKDLLGKNTLLLKERLDKKKEEINKSYDDKMKGVMVRIRSKWSCDSDCC